MKKDTKIINEEVNFEKKKTVSTIKYLALAFALLLGVRYTYTQTVGEVEILSDLEKEMDEIGLTLEKNSSGIYFEIGGQKITYDQAIEIIRKATITCDMSEGEAYIAVNALFYDSIAEDVVGEENIPTTKEMIKIKEKAFQERKTN